MTGPGDIGGGMINAARSVMLTLWVGVLSGLSVLALGTKSVVLVPALACVAGLMLIPYSGLYAIVATTPVNVVLAGPVTVARLALLLCFCSILVQSGRGQIPVPRLFLWPEGIAPALFFLWLGFATFATGQGGLVGRLGPFAIYGFIFFVVLNYTDTVGRLRTIFVVLVLIAGVQALLAMIETQFGVILLRGANEELASTSRSEEFRFTGTSTHPIALAGFLQLALAAAGTLGLTSRNRKIRVLCLLMVPALLATWWVTYSRSSWIGMATMILTAMFLLSRVTRMMAIIGSVAALILLAQHDYSAPAVLDTLQGLISANEVETTAGLAGGSDSLLWRFENWAAAWAIFKEHPVLGIGLEMSRGASFSHLPLGAVAHQYIDTAVPHNLFLFILAETGIVSFVLFVLIWITALQGLLVASRQSALRPYAIGLFTGLVGVTGTYFFNPMPREIWLALALCLALGRVARHCDNPRGG